MSMSANLHRPVFARATALPGVEAHILTIGDASENYFTIFCAPAIAEAMAGAFRCAKEGGEMAETLMAVIDCAGDFPGSEESIINATDLLERVQAHLDHCEDQAAEQASADPYDRHCDEEKENT